MNIQIKVTGMTKARNAINLWKADKFVVSESEYIRREEESVYEKELEAGWIFLRQEDIDAARIINMPTFVSSNGLSKLIVFDDYGIAEYDNEKFYYIDTIKSIDYINGLL